MKITQEEIKRLLYSDKTKMTDLTKKQLVMIIVAQSLELNEMKSELAFQHRQLVLKHGLAIITKNKK